MEFRKLTRTRGLPLAAIILLALITNQLLSNLGNTFIHHNKYNNVQAIQRSGAHGSPGSVAAIMNTPKMGTGGLQASFARSWKCQKSSDVMNSELIVSDKLDVDDCAKNRRVLRTHGFIDGSKGIQNHRERHPEGECLIVTAIRSPSAWFSSFFLQGASNHWKSTEEMLRNYNNYLISLGNGSEKHWIDRLHSTLPDLLKEFNAGTLVEQSRIMDENGGYSLLGPASQGSILAGCELLFLRMEQSDRYEKIFQMLDPEIENKRGRSRLDQNPDATAQISAITSYEMSAEEKTNLYHSGSDFIRDWFDSYGYMDDVADDVKNVIAVNTDVSHTVMGQLADTNVT